MVIWKELEQIEQTITDVLLNKRFVVVCQSGVIYESVRNLVELTDVPFVDLLKDSLNVKQVSCEDDEVTQIQDTVDNVLHTLVIWKSDLESCGYKIANSLDETKQLWAEFRLLSDLEGTSYLDFITKSLDSNMGVYYDRDLNGMTYKLPF